MIPAGPKSTWEEQARETVRKGYPEVAEQLPGLVMWLQDLNWPGALTVAEFLVQIGAPVVPHLKEVLAASDDRMWQYWIITEVVEHLGPDLISGMVPELKVLSTLQDDEGAGQAARDVLEQYGLGG